MKLRINYAYLPAVVITVAVGGSFITSSGLDWYRTLVLGDGYQIGFKRGDPRR